METDQKTPGQVLYEAIVPEVLNVPWSELRSTAVKSWECGAAAVIAHDRANQPAANEVRLGMTVDQLAAAVELGGGSAWPAKKVSYLHRLITESLSVVTVESGVARPLSDWHEDDGPVLWWLFPVDEAPWVGGPNDHDWPGYHTHWTALPAAPEAPKP